MNIIPEIILIIGMISIILADLLLGKKPHISYFLTQLTLMLSIFILAYFKLQYDDMNISFEGHKLLNKLTFVLQELILIISFLFFIYSKDSIKISNFPQSEFYILTIVSILGAIVLTSANSFLIIYIGLELLYLPIYSLIALNRRYIKGIEASIKIFILGAITSGLLLYGMSLIYGITGSLKLTDINMFLLNNIHINTEINIIILALLLIMTTTMFKLGVFPFHMLVPDIYEGSPNYITGFLASIPKIAILYIIINIFIFNIPQEIFNFKPIMIIISVSSIFIGNFLALFQKNIKRLLGYSSIANMGILLLGLITNNYIALYYLIVYIIMTISFFGIIMLLKNKIINIDDFLGLNNKNSWLAFLILIILFSMIGLPPFSGFIAKFLVIRGLFEDGYLYLGIYVIFMSIIASYYYLRIIVNMYFVHHKTDNIIPIIKPLTLLILSVNVVCILLLGIFPSILINILLQMF